MGQAKQKRAHAFSPSQITAWEADDCVNFAIALARITGWLLHIDGLADSQKAPIEEITLLRVYVGDNADKIFDVHGIKSIKEFSERTITPLIKTRAKTQNNVGVATKYLSEEKLRTLSLRRPIDEDKINQARKAIEENPEYLKLIPKRYQPLMPAHEAADYTFGLCAPYAEALNAATGLEATSISALKYQPMFRYSKIGYVHSFVMHADGMAEDSWGKQTIDRIAERFGIAEYTLSKEEHARIVKNLKANSPDRFAEVLKKAETAIKNFR